MSRWHRVSARTRDARTPSPGSARARRTWATRVLTGAAAALTLCVAGTAAGGEVPQPACAAGRVMGVFAHQDDDILFANPDIAGRIARGQCVFTVYLSAGDAGQPAQYWAGREQGSRAAYAMMARRDDRWTRRVVSAGGRPVLTYVLRADPRISVGFMRLPDGLNRGSGFESTGYRTLYRLWTGEITDIWSVDGAHWTRPGLVRAVRALATAYRPQVVLTNDFSRPFQCVPEPGTCIRPFDHSDHTAAGYVTRAAVPALFRAGRVIGAKGYPAVFEDPPNVDGATLARKAAIFAAYNAHDPLVCQGVDACLDDFEYGSFLRRQYLIRSR